MKKLLALVLALVMTLGLATVSSNAAFTDEEKIDHTEAVEVMNALGIINGMGDGTFNPDGNVTRAQMAKMVAIAVLGDIDPAAFAGAASDLTDIEGHWAEGYIKYCVSQGIIAGRGNGTFAPNDNVTTVEAAKMLLVALGYNADVRKYVGSSWTLNVMRDAQQSGLLDKLTKSATTVAMDRDDAAQMIYNTITTNSIRAVDTYNSDGTTSTQYQPNGTPLLTKTFKAKEYVGVLTEGNTTYSSSNKKYSYDGAAAFTNKADNTDVHGNNPFGSKTDYTAYLGEEVTVVVSTASNGDETVINIAPTGKSTVVETAQSAVKAVTGKTDQVKIDGTTYNLETPLTAAGLIDANSYDMLKLVDSDANGKLDILVRTTVTPAKVTYVSSTEIIAGSTIKFADHNIASGLAKDDYVTVVTDRYTDVKTVEKLEAIEGKITGKKAGDNLVQVNGTWYNDEGSNVVLPNFAGNLTLNTAYKFYAVNGVICAATTTDNASIGSLVMVIDKDTTSLNKQALILKADGTTETVALDLTSTGAVNPTLGGFYTYSETSKGYKFTAAATITSGGTTYTYAAGKAAGVTGADGSTITTGTVIGSMEDGSSTDYQISDTAVIFVWGANDNSGTVITGKQLKNLTLQSAGNADGKINSTSLGVAGFFHSTSSGLDRVTYAGVQTSKVSELGVTSGNKNYAYVTEASYAVQLSGGAYQAFKIWNGTDNLTVYEKGATARPKGTVMYYDAIDSDSIITGVNVYTVTNTGTNSGNVISEVGAIRGIDGKNLYLDGVAAANKIKITSDTKYLYVDTNASDAEEIGLAAGEVVMAAENDGTNHIWRDNVVAVTNASDEIVLLVVDVKNNYTSTANKTLDVASPTLTNASAMTLTLSCGAAGDADVAKIGDLVTLTVTGTGTVAAGKTITLTNAYNYADQTATITLPALSSGTVLTYTLVVAANNFGAVNGD